MCYHRLPALRRTMDFPRSSLVPRPIRARVSFLLLVMFPPAASFAVPTGTNLGFESNLTGWTSSGVTIETSKVHAGSKSLALRGGFIQQGFSGLSPGETHTLKLAYRDNTQESWVLSHARVLIDGEVIAEIHTGQSAEFLFSGGFEFTASSSDALLRIESLEPGPAGLLIDSVSIVTGSLPSPPQHAWSGLTQVSDARGGRRLANGSFEQATSDPASDPHNYGPVGNPHLAELSLPGWRVTRENVDVIESDGAMAPHGTKALDTGGHGPGGIAQTITGLQPHACYTFSFLHARHVSWGEEDMTGEVHSNGRLVARLVRTIDQTWEDGYELREIPVLASEAGELTLELRSTTTDQGGNIIYDDVRLRQGGDGFLAWTLHHGLEADPEDDADGDGIDHGLEFIFGTDPHATDTLPGMTSEEGQRLLKIPISGLSRSADFSHRLWCSRDLNSWKVASEAESGMTLVSDSSAPGANGERVFRIDPPEGRLFWKHAAVAP